MSPSDPLEQLNHAFRDAYAARREAVLTALGPAVAAIDDVLIFRFRGQRLVGPARTRRYHELKTLCHLPLAIQAIVGGGGEEDDGPELDDIALARLAELRRHVEAVTRSLETRDFDDAEREHQRRILTDSAAFLDGLIAHKRSPLAPLIAFLRAQTPAIQHNLERAAHDQLTTMHATFGAWKQTMTAAEWAELRVVVGASHMARTGNVAAQYFAVALGEPWQGRFDHEQPDGESRVLTSESATDEHAAFALLAMHAFDARASNYFFAEDDRLGRDVLANAAERQLSEMFGERPDRPT